MLICCYMCFPKMIQNDGYIIRIYILYIIIVLIWTYEIMKSLETERNHVVVLQSWPVHRGWALAPGLGSWWSTIKHYWIWSIIDTLVESAWIHHEYRYYTSICTWLYVYTYIYIYICIYIYTYKTMVLHYNASIYHGSFPPGDGGISRHDQGPSGGVSVTGLTSGDL